MSSTKQIGDSGEDLAVDYLTGQGYLVVERNFRTKFGEIDIIALDKDTLCFVEVKKKTGDGFGAPAEMITPRKIFKIKLTAEYYIQEKDLGNVLWRIDAVLIDGNRMELLKNVTS